MVKIEMRKLGIVVAALLIVLTIVLAVLFIVFSQPSDTILYVDPANKVASPGESFNINIKCDPVVPIKAWEFKISFDPNRLTANTVTEGNLFAGYTTFFSNGTINNAAGTIINLYNVILGTGNVSDAGSCITINFTAKTGSGTTIIGIYDAGVTNETEYIPITIDNGTVTVDATAPVISNINRATSTPLDTDPLFGWVNITCKVTDNIGVQQVRLDSTKTGGGNTNTTMPPIGGDYYYSNNTIVFPDYGNYTYHIWGIDVSTNQVVSTNYSFSLPPNYDVNNDGKMNILDFVVCSNSYGSTGVNGWTREDVDNNGKIQIIDMVYISNHYNEIWWT